MGRSWAGLLPLGYALTLTVSLRLPGTENLRRAGAIVADLAPAAEIRLTALAGKTMIMPTVQTDHELTPPARASPASALN